MLLKRSWLTDPPPLCTCKLAKNNVVLHEMAKLTLDKNSWNGMGRLGREYFTEAVLLKIKKANKRNRK